MASSDFNIGCLADSWGVLMHWKNDDYPSGEKRWFCDRNARCAEHLHAQLHYENQAKAVDKRLMRTYQVKLTQGGLYLTELPHAEKPSPSQATVLISTVKLPMNK